MKSQMRKRIAKYGHFFVLFAFLVGIIAPACGFAWNGKYSVIEICTTEGIESRVVKNDEQPEKSHISEQCQFCFAQANLKSFLPEVKTIEKTQFTYQKTQFQQFETVFLSRRTNDHAARAPPAFI